MNAPGMTLCFTSLSRENTAALVETTLNLPHELSDVYTDEKAHETFIKVMKEMSGLVTDRAARNKSFGHALDMERRSILQTDDKLHFTLSLGAKCSV